MDDFLTKFFPTVERNKNRVSSSDSDYCKYNNQGLQAFTSSLYLAALVASFFASFTTRLLGRKITMLIAGLSFLCGATLNAAAQDLAMLILGRILLGVGVGFANQVELLSSLHKQTNLRQVNSFLLHILYSGSFFLQQHETKGRWIDDRGRVVVVP
jgi:MFS family permease